MLGLRGINQISLIVENLDDAMRRYWQFGIGPWHIWAFPLKNMTYRGRADDYRMRLAVADLGGLMLELIQPLSQEGIYAEHLRRKGPGLHHIGILVPSLDEAVSGAAEAGIKVLTSGRGLGRHGDGGYAYLDTQNVLGMIVEVIEMPKEFVVPDAVYPSGDGQPPV